MIQFWCLIYVRMVTSIKPIKEMFHQKGIIFRLKIISPQTLEMRTCILQIIHAPPVMNQFLIQSFSGSFPTRTKSRWSCPRSANPCFRHQRVCKRTQGGNFLNYIHVNLVYNFTITITLLSICILIKPRISAARFSHHMWNTIRK